MTAMQAMKKQLRRTLWLAGLFCLPILMNAQNSSGEIEIRKVCIDPGHGGRDPGAVGSFSYEKDLVLDMALKLGGYIKEHFPDVEVIYTRKTDKFVKLYERAKIANDADADLFISIHINAAGSPRAYGTETFAMGLDKSEANLAIAKKENAVILKEENYEENYEGFDPASPESHIMFSMFQNAYLDQSLNLAAIVQDQFRERVGRFDRGVKQANFWVLYKVAMPSILIEAGFISNPEEEKFLNTENGITYMSSAIFRAFKEYKKAYEADNLLAGDEINDLIGENPQEDTLVETDSLTEETSGYSEADSLGLPSYPPSDNEDEICFRVQIGTSSEAIQNPDKHFPGIDDFWQYKHNGSYKHTAGKTTDYMEIIELQKELKSQYKGCFIVAFKNKERISVREAIEALNK